MFMSLRVSYNIFWSYLSSCPALPGQTSLPCPPNLSPLFFFFSFSFNHNEFNFCCPHHLGSRIIHRSTAELTEATNLMKSDSSFLSQQLSFNSGSSGRDGTSSHLPAQLEIFSWIKPCGTVRSVAPLWVHRRICPVVSREQSFAGVILTWSPSSAVTPEPWEEGMGHRCPVWG